jgi:hypothetical protein
MGQQIRTLMGGADHFETLKGHVEIDETLVGGMGAGKGIARKMENKTIVMGLKERGGPMITETIPDASTGSLRPHASLALCYNIGVSDAPAKTQRRFDKLCVSIRGQLFVQDPFIDANYSGTSLSVVGPVQRAAACAYDRRVPADEL